MMKGGSIARFSNLKNPLDVHCTLLYNECVQYLTAPAHKGETRLCYQPHNAYL